MLRRHSLLHTALLGGLTAFFLFVSSPALAQTEPANDTPTSSEASEPSPSGNVGDFGPGDIDLALHLGLSGLLYGQIEPGVDVGLVPITDEVTLSVGGQIGFGACLLCGIISAALPNFSWGATNISPQGRIGVHLDLIDDGDMGVKLDGFGGLYGGPNFYRFRVRFEDEGRVTGGITSWILGGYGGVRMFFGELNPFFLSAEMRLGAEIGFNEIIIRDEDWPPGEEFRVQNSYSQRVVSTMVGLGFRI